MIYALYLALRQTQRTLYTRKPIRHGYTTRQSVITANTMQISQEFGNARYIINGYEEGKVVVNNTEFKRSLIIMPESLHEDWEPQTLDELNKSHLEFISELRPEIVIFGTGAQQRFPNVRVQAFFMGQRIGIEFMNTAAACRTYNILMSEGRNVVCALFMR